MVLAKARSSAAELDLKGVESLTSFVKVAEVINCLVSRPVSLTPEVRRTEDDLGDFHANHVNRLLLSRQFEWRWILC